LGDYLGDYLGDHLRRLHITSGVKGGSHHPAPAATHHQTYDYGKYCPSPDHQGSHSLDICSSQVTACSTLSSRYSRRIQRRHTPRATMKAALSLASAVMAFGTTAAASCAGPAASGLAFDISLSDDITGENQVQPVRVNGGAVTLGSLFAGQAGDRIFATSLQAVSPGVAGGNVLCAIVNPLDADNALRLNAEATFVDLDGDGGAAVQVDVTDFTVACEL
jgi:hypothetical protein